MNNNLDFLERVRQQLFEFKNENWHREHSLINRVIEEIEWKNRTSTEKHEHRKAAFSISSKWAKDSFSNEVRISDPSNDYPEAIVEVYEMTIRLLDRITLVDETNTLQRLKALLLIEQHFFDEKIIPDRHVPLDMFNLIAKESFNKDIALELTEYIKAYKNLWNLWPKNPYLKKRGS